MEKFEKIVQFWKIGENLGNLIILLFFEKPSLESKIFTLCIGKLKFFLKMQLSNTSFLLQTFSQKSST